MKRSGDHFSLWDLPFPSSGRDNEKLTVEPGRKLVVSYQGENAEGVRFWCDLRFTDVAAYRVNYLPALRRVHLDAYDKLIERKDSSWLLECESVLASFDYARTQAGGWRHLEICFDDGPAYEVLCRGFEAKVRSSSGDP